MESVLAPGGQSHKAYMEAGAAGLTGDKSAQASGGHHDRPGGRGRPGWLWKSRPGFPRCRLRTRCGKGRGGGTLLLPLLSRLCQDVPRPLPWVRGSHPREGVHCVPSPGRDQASIFKPKWGLVLPVSRSKCSLLCEQPQRPRAPVAPWPPLVLDCCYLKASWSGPEKGVIGGLGDERGQPSPRGPALTEGSTKPSLWPCQLQAPRGATGPDRRRDCPPPWGELGSLSAAHGALGC